MLRTSLLLVAALVIVSASAATAAIKPTKPKPPKTPELVEKGHVIYVKRCSFCHGIDGGGDGPVAEFLNPRPRNFQTNVFKFRSTGSGALPLDEDLFETISKGINGTAMQSFDDETMKTGLTEEERWAVIYYIQTFGLTPDFSLWMLDEDYAKSDDPGERAEYRYNKVMKIGDPPPASPEIVAKGKEVYTKAKCFQCHGDAGLGNGVSAEGMKDDWQFPIVPRDLTKGWKYKGGVSVEEIFFRFTTGLNGTPMPSFAQTVPEDERWALAYYVNSLIYEPEKGRNLTVKLMEGDLPLDPADPAWETADQVDVWLTGNVLIKPRWQNITIDMVHLKALYNGEEIAFRLEWHDRFPNTVHEGHDDLHQLDQAKPGDEGNLATYVPIYSEDYNPGRYRDAVMLQFPKKLAKGTEKPHFLNGDRSHAVNLWWWRADYDPVKKDLAAAIAGDSKLKSIEKYVVGGEDREGAPVLELNAKGFKKPFKTQPAESQGMVSKAGFKDGKWTLVMKRPLLTDDKNDIQFEQGRFIPVAVNAWDGWNGDIGMRKSISSWHYVYLERPTPMGVYVATGLAIILLAGVEVRLIREWRKR
ncbi:MAG: c-type cytochrome [Candidatus Nitrospinota bacterium M3_3B_026]